MSHKVINIDETPEVIEVISRGPQGTKGDRGTGIPTEGLPGQFLVKTSFSDFDVDWVNASDAGSLPVGGVYGQVLVKNSELTFDAKWADPSINGAIPAGGTTGQLLAKATDADYEAEWVDKNLGSLANVDSTASHDQVLYFDAVSNSYKFRNELNPSNDFSYVEVVPETLVSSTVYTPLLTLFKVGLKAGTYRVDINLTYGMDTDKKSIIFKSELNGGNVSEISREVADKTNQEVVTVSYPYVQAVDGNFLIEVSAKLVDAFTEGVIHLGNIMLERKT